MTLSMVKMERGHSVAEGKEDSIYMAPLSTHAYSQSAQSLITQFYLQTTLCLPFLRKRAELVVNFRRSISLGSYSGLKSQVVEDFGDKFASFEKTIPYGEIFKILFQKDSSRRRPCLVCKFIRKSVK